MATKDNKFGVGVRQFFVYPLKEESDSTIPTYEDALETTTTNAIKVTRNKAEATADGDDKQVANISITTSLTVEWTCWGMSYATEAALFGHDVSEAGQIDEKSDDIAPYVGIGYIKTLADSKNAKTYKAHFYYKCQAVQGDEESNSSGSNLTLASTSVTFNALEPAYGPMRSVEEFDTEAAAIAWIKSIAGES